MLQRPEAKEEEQGSASASSAVASASCAAGKDSPSFCSLLGRFLLLGPPVCCVRSWFLICSAVLYRGSWFYCVEYPLVCIRKNQLLVTCQPSHRHARTFLGSTTLPSSLWWCWLLWCCWAEFPSSLWSSAHFFSCRKHMQCFKMPTLVS
jgi:hypothetical protein